MSPVFRRTSGRPAGQRCPRLAAVTVATLLVGSGYAPFAQSGRGREAGRGRIAPAGPSAVALEKVGLHVPAVLDARFSLESGPVHFGEVLSGEPKDLPGGIRARVFADGEWSLSLVPRVPLRMIGGGDFLARSSRLAWRSETSGDFEPFLEGRPAVVASGAATGPGGQLIVIDLRMELAEHDDIGWYECRLDLTLDSRSTRSISH